MQKEPHALRTYGTSVLVGSLLTAIASYQSAYAAWEMTLERWDVEVNTNEIAEFVESESNERILKIWVRRNLNDPVPVGLGFAKSSVFLYSISCEKRKYSLGATAYSGYDYKGPSLYSAPPSPFKHFNDIAPDTLESALADKYCKKRWQFWR